MARQEPPRAESIRSWLRPGERVVWEGRPDVVAYAMRGAWYLLPFSLFFAGFAIFWEAMAIVGHAPPFFVVRGIPFIGVGLYLLVGRIWVALREAENTTYLLTDRRILIETGAFRRRMIQLDLRDLPMAQLDAAASGRGTITFGGTMNVFRMPPGWPAAGMYARPPAFEAIPDARETFELVQRTKAEARGEAM